MKVALKSDIALANRSVTMSFVCKQIGMSDVDYASSGAKVDCPFAFLYHPDGQKSFRIYEDATAYCYACGEKFSPVQLYARVNDLSLDDASDRLLELAGYKPPTAEERFEKATSTATVIDQNALMSALKTYCARNFPDWEERQTDAAVASKFVQCVELLPYLRTPEDTRTWLGAAKTAMSRVLGEPT